MTENMYADTKTWNPFKGCEFDCAYCIPSFQRQAKRQKHRCQECYNYTPHCHEDRLKKIPSANTVFVCGNSDISFCSVDYMRKIIARIVDHNRRAAHKTYYLQSKQPECFEPLLNELPANVVLLTTLETNRDEGYDLISKAPKPTVRYQQLIDIDYPRKVVTIEPVLDFDLDIFTSWIINIHPEYVWLGFDSKNTGLPEPTSEKVKQLVERLKKAGVEVRYKTMR